MSIARLILTCAVTVLSVVGCNAASQTPSTGFQLTLLDLVTDANVRAAMLTIHTANEGSMSVDSPGSHDSIALPSPDANRSRTGSVAIVASLFAPPGDRDIYIQTLIKSQTPNAGSAGGTSVYTVPRTVTLADHFNITAKSGNYPLNTPIEIARLNGMPVTLTVGKPTR